MAKSLTGPVGRRNRAQNVANISADQSTVIALLASVPQSQGGKQESWATPPLSGPSGACPSWVSDAIWEFQSFWKAKGIFHHIDGVVDPGGHTLRHLNVLAAGGVAPPSLDAPPDPPASPDVPETPLRPVITRLQRVFSYQSTWRFTSSSGVNASVAVIGGGIGVLYLEDTASNAQRRLVFGGLGGSLGPLPAGVSWSTPDTPSMGIGRLYTREDIQLDLSDLNGPAIILTAGCVGGVGGGMSIYLLGVTNVAGWLGALNPAVFGASLLNAAANATAMGTMCGDGYGIDIGAGIWQGMAVGEPSINKLFG